MHKIEYPVPLMTIQCQRPNHQNPIDLLFTQIQNQKGMRKWPLRSETTAGQKNVAHTALADPLHIKLPLIKIFVKLMDKESKEFAY
jgi:hypothetical protein